MKKVIVAFILGGLTAIFGSFFVALIAFAKALENKAFAAGVKNTIVDSVELWIKNFVYGDRASSPLDRPGVVNYQPYNRPFYGSRSTHRGPKMPTPEPTVGPNGN